MQHDDGIVGGGWPDGNFSRTNIMYSLWKTQGTHVRPWRKDIILGADRSDDTLKISLSGIEAWKGILTFDYKRHAEILHLPIDYPRLNQFPEWFTANREAKYRFKVLNHDIDQVYTGEQLVNGVPFEMKSNSTYHIIVLPEK